MTLAPHETQEGYARKNELMAIRDTRTLSMPELYELRDLTKAAISHLVFATHSKKESKNV